MIVITTPGTVNESSSSGRSAGKERQRKRGWLRMADAKVTFETELDTSGLKSGIDALEGVGAGSLIGAIGGKSVLAKIGSTIGNLIGSSMVAAFAKAVGETGMEFNAQFALVSAAVGYQSEQLRALAIEAGDTTQYTAAEAAEAMREMALAGWSEERIMSSFYDVLNLATVGSMDFAAAAEAIGNSMNAFGLETGETTRLIDELSTADVNASTSVAELTRGFLTLGATGRNLAGGTTEAATAMALLSDNGI